MTGPASEAVTRGVRVTVRTRFVPQQSDPAAWRFLWAYQVTIANEGDERVQLISRHWRIEDALGRVEEVQGPGVVGEQPVLEPGESHTYVSACPLPTHSGRMWGTYQMVTADGDGFDAEVAPFDMFLPQELN